MASGHHPAPAAILQMEATAGLVCMALGAEKLLDRNGAGALLTALANYFAPDALEAANQDVGRSSNFAG